MVVIKVCHCPCLLDTVMQAAVTPSYCQMKSETAIVTSDWRSQPSTLPKSHELASQQPAATSASPVMVKALRLTQGFSVRWPFSSHHS